MQILWSGFAKECLKDISFYYKHVAGPKISNKIRSQIFRATRHLVKYPASGQEEPFLKGQDQVFRYIIAGRFKIIYTIEGRKILITDVFDTRQNPIKVNKPGRNK